MKGMTLTEALAAARAGNVVARKAWEGSGVFVYAQVPNLISAVDTVPNMQSLPDAVKSIFAGRLEGDLAIKGVDALEYQSIGFRTQYNRVNAHNLIDSFIPGQKERIAQDWEIIEPAAETIIEGEDITVGEDKELQVGEFPSPEITYTDKEAADQAGVKQYIQEPSPRFTGDELNRMKDEIGWNNADAKASQDAGKDE